MKLFLRLLLPIATLATSALQAELVVESGEIREPIPGTTAAAAYMTLHNSGATEVVINSVTSPAAARVSLHTTMNHNGMLHMTSMDSLTILAAGRLALEEGGIHLMLEMPSAAVLRGREVELLLHFADGTEQSISLPVRSVLDR